MRKNYESRKCFILHNPQKRKAMGIDCKITAGCPECMALFLKV